MAVLQSGCCWSLNRDFSILKAKVKLSLCLIKHLTMNMCMGEWRHSSTSAINPGSQLHAPAALPLGKEPSPTHYIEIWGRGTADRGAVENRKVFCPCRESKSGLPARSL
jgi:hypothetical protein